MRSYLLPLTFVAGLGPIAANADAPSVVTDIAPVGAIVARVMEGVGEPSVLVPPNASPHDFALRPSQARALSDADLVVWIGAGLSGFLSGPLHALARDGVGLAVMEGPVALLPMRQGIAFELEGHDHDHGHGHGHGHGHADEAAHDDHGHDDHAEKGDDHDAHDHDAHDHDAHDHDAHDHEAEGHADHAENEHEDHGHEDHGHSEKDHDDHGHDDDVTYDPHLWLDPANAVILAGMVAEAVSDLDPENAALYSANAAAFAAEMDVLRAEITAQLDPVRGAGFIVLHDAFQYFENAFDMPAQAALMDGDASSPGAARLSDLRSGLAEAPVACAFAEPQMDTKLLATAVEGTETRIGTLDPMGASDLPMSAQYSALLRGLATAMADCLSGEQG